MYWLASASAPQWLFQIVKGFVQCHCNWSPALTDFHWLSQKRKELPRILWWQNYQILDADDVMRPERGPQDFLYGHMSICGHMAICPYDHMAIRVSGLVSNPKCPSLTDLQVLAALIDRLESPLSRLKPQTSSFSLSLSELLSTELTQSCWGPQIFTFLQKMFPFLSFSVTWWDSFVFYEITCQNWRKGKYWPS